MNKAIAGALIFAAMTVSTVSTAAHAAGFVNDRTGWLGLSLEARLGYTQALNDSINYIYADDSLAEALAKKGRTNCLIQQKASAAILAERITATYKNDQYANLPPSAVYIISMAQVCAPYINQARLEFGLGAQ